MTTSRQSEILAVLVEEFRADGCEVFTTEGDTYARVAEPTETGAIIMIERNLTTLAAQIDRRIN
jgi:hypothetical protein